MDEEKRELEMYIGLGDKLNPLYTAKLLQKSTSDLIGWIQDNLHNIQPTLLETRSYAQQYHVLGNETYRDSLLLGARILTNNFTLVLLVLKEIQSRTEAIRLTPEQSQS